MGIEIERKFLVTGTAWRQGTGVRFIQGYLNRDKGRTVRVRLAGEKAFLTIKGVSVGATRAEFEYEIPAADAEQLLKLSDGPIIENDSQSHSARRRHVGSG
jgi:adenylate cyclase